MSKELKLVRRASVGPAFSFSQFSPAQQSVIDHRHSPLAIYGGPGTGKTTTLIQSVISRVAQGVDPNSILIITYSRQSASALRDAIALRAESTSFEPLARTFHSLAFSILNEKLAADNTRYVLASGAEQESAIAEMLANPLVPMPWPADLMQAISTRGFAREVRDLILRATELGLTPKDLQQRALIQKEPYWDAVAHFWASYHGANELKSATVGEKVVRIDPSAIISEAIYLLEHDSNRLDYFRKRFTTIVVDEFQESDPSQRKLLQLLAPTDLLIFADPDSAIGRFRGADPDSVVQAITKLADEKIFLSESYRSGEPIIALINQVGGGFQANSKVRTPLIARHGGNTRVPELAKLSSSSESANYIAHAFRSAHLHDHLPWSKMAIIVRSPGNEISALQRACAQNGVPIVVDSSALALADNPAVKPILLLAGVILKSFGLKESDWPVIEEILFSEFGGADPLELRKIRLAFASVRTDQRSTTSMMVDALTESTAELPWEQIAPIKRLNDLIKVGRKALRGSADISDLLWAIWENAVDYEGRNIAQLWRNRALEGGVRGAQADRDLDAVIELFEAARRFTERNIGARPELFLSQLLNERILSDSITAAAQREEVVTITTVHHSKGLEWDFVVVTGLQEGSWPNLKERGSLLGSERLVESMRSGLTARAEITASAAAGLVDDERRLLYVAISRAKNRLLIVARSDEDSEPSRYFEEVFEYIHGTTSDNFYSLAPRQITTPALVATLRREVDSGSEFAASLLKTLGDEGVSSADPKNWLGARQLSSNDPVASPGENIYVSPSSLSTFDDCGLKWFLERSGAKDADSTAQLLGVAVHYIASQVFKNPELSADEAIAQLTAAWPVVDQSVGWYKTQQLKDATAMLRKFFEWNSENPRDLVAVEAEFEAQFGRAIVKGSVDRLERDPQTGKYFVVDIKTGTPSTKSEAAENKQLAAYQLAVLNKSFEGMPDHVESAGAGLLFLKREVKKLNTLDQPPIDPEVVKAEVVATADGMAAATFKAVINKQCRNCAIRSLCPLQSEGGSVIDL